MTQDQTTADTDLPDLWLHQGVPFWRDPVSRAVYQLQPDHWEGVFADVPAEAVRLVPDTTHEFVRASLEHDYTVDHDCPEYDTDEAERAAALANIREMHRLLNVRAERLMAAGDQITEFRKRDQVHEDIIRRQKAEIDQLRAVIAEADALYATPTSQVTAILLLKKVHDVLGKEISRA